MKGNDTCSDALIIQVLYVRTHQNASKDSEDT